LAGEPGTAPPQPLWECPDRPLIESALAAPRAGFGDFERYPTLPEKAAALAYHLAKSQACPKGNKRVALILLVAFLRINGHTLTADVLDPSDAAALMILGAAEAEPADRDRVVEGLSEWMRAHIEPRR
jgi:death on curing protein